MLNEITIHGYLGRDPEIKDYTNAKGEAGFIINMFDLLSRFQLVKIEPLAWLVK